MKPSKKKWLRFVIVIIVLIIIGVTLYLGYNKLKDKNESEVNAINIPETAIKVSILNGCGFPGIATEVKEKLMRKGKIDVIAWKNNTRNMYIYKQTIIIAKHNEPEKLAYLQSITGIPFRAYAYNSNNIEEFFIVLGLDYKQYFK
jgi:hypothetical protein